MRALVVLVPGVLLLAGCTVTVAGAPAPSTDKTELCAYLAPLAPGVFAAPSEYDVFAPCVEGDRFRLKMRELGFPENTTYMPTVAADTCQRKAAGLPLESWGQSPKDAALHRAFRQAEIAARCPD
jgi:hypothetical protein